jgi:hypothetical protein
MEAETVIEEREKDQIIKPSYHQRQILGGKVCLIDRFPDETTHCQPWR